MSIKSLSVATSLVATLVLLQATANATLIDHGKGLIYDDVLDITWMQDANYAKTSGYDADGIMTWSEAMNWASRVVYAGYGGWRLPSALNSDGTGPCLGDNCTDSEFGHIVWTDELVISPEGTHFKNIQASSFIPGDSYWTSTEYSSSEAWAWRTSRFEHLRGQKLLDNVDPLGNEIEVSVYGWAVHDGDVAAEVSFIESLLKPHRAMYSAVNYHLLGNYLIDKETTSDESRLVLLTSTGYDILDLSAYSTGELPTENLALLSPAGLIALHAEAVPEAGTLTLLSLGLVVIVLVGHRKIETLIN